MSYQIWGGNIYTYTSEFSASKGVISFVTEVDAVLQSTENRIEVGRRIDSSRIGIVTKRKSVRSSLIQRRKNIRKASERGPPGGELLVDSISVLKRYKGAWLTAEIFPTIPRKKIKERVCIIGPGLDFLSQWCWEVMTVVRGQECAWHMGGVNQPAFSTPYRV